MKPQDCERLTLFPGASRDCASPFLAQEKGAESWTTAICGPKCSGLSPNLRRVGLSLKTYLESCVLPLPTLSRTWKVQAITPSCLCMKLRLSARRTAAPASPSSPTEPQLWATPNTMDHLPQRSPEALIRQATTTRKGRTRPANLREQVCPETVQMWPTPTAADSYTDRLKSSQQKAGSMHSVNLSSAVKMWPTPTSRDYKDGSAAACRNVPVNGLLGRAVHQDRLLTTPTASDAVGTHGGGNSRSLRTDAGGQLNPTWVEWLMGYPEGWTELKPSEMP